MNSFCANTYYLNQHLHQLDIEQRYEERAEEIAAQEIKDTGSQFYAYDPENVGEALESLDEKTINRFIATQDDPVRFLEVYKDVVEGYWFEQAKLHAMEHNCYE